MGIHTEQDEVEILRGKVAANRDAANRAIWECDRIKGELAIMHERCTAHSYVQKLEQLCRDLHRGLVYALVCAEVPLEGNGTYQDMKQRMADLGLLEGEQ